MVLPLTGAARIGDLGRTEGLLKILRERQHDLVRRRRHGAADQRTGVIEEGVGPRRDGSERNEKERDEKERFSHGDTSELELLRGGPCAADERLADGFWEHVVEIKM
jgi:hypothetical protein